MINYDNLKLMAKAIDSLRPLSQWHLKTDSYETLKWLDEEQSKPTKKEVDDEMARLQAEYETNEYQRLRQYPSIGDQLDMLWHAIDTNSLNKTSDFYTTLKAVKDAYPKSGE